MQLKKAILLIAFIPNLNLPADAQSVPIANGKGLYSLSCNNVSMEIDANTGGRISSFKLNGLEFLFTDKKYDTWGSTFWTSPQSAWGWPPSANINMNKYLAVINKYTIDLTSQKDEKLGLVINKTIQCNPKDTSFSITYSILNTSEEVKHAAPWEITRVAPGGLTLFPSGQPGKRGALVPLLKDSIGISWFMYQGDKIPAGVPKFFGDGRGGWLAQISGDLVLIKKFTNIEPQEAAPEEAEIELYAKPDKTYIEIEQQGKYASIEKGQKTSWEVKWFLRVLPSNVKAEIGSSPLVTFIENIIK